MIYDLKDRQMMITTENCKCNFIHLLQQLKEVTDKLQLKHMPGVNQIYDLRLAEPIQPKKTQKGIP